MALKIEPDFKEALLNLPEKEKNKYLLRLLKKDKILFHRLHFELVSLDSQDERRSIVEQEIKQRINTNATRSAGYVKKLLRSISGQITYHVRTTNDKFGDSYLNTLMLITALSQFNHAISTRDSYAIEQLNKYIVARIYKILGQVQKLHEDDQFEFKQLFQDLYNLIQENQNLKKDLISTEFNFDWLTNNSIPADIQAIAKDRRARGLI